MATSDYRVLIDSLKRYPTRSALYRSSFYAEHGANLEAIIDRLWERESPKTRPRVGAFVRAVQWNILRGKHLDAIVDLFTNHPVMRWADIIALNEVDIGMNRTGNRNVAFELGERLGMHAIFVPEYLEMTKGTGSELLLEGENREALHGNAILTRFPVRARRFLRLPSCFDTFQFWEKRYGDRVALICELEVQRRTLVVAATHLEVRNTPECRGRQFRALLDEVAPSGKDAPPILIAGDLNTGTFKRGHLGHALMAFVKLVSSKPDIIKEALRHPERAEPLFALAAGRGFRFEEFNDDMSTCVAPLNALDEADYCPPPLRRWIFSRLAAYDHQLAFRLDYFLARGLRALKDGEIVDNQHGVASKHAHTINGLTCNGQDVSDHDPIVCDFLIE